MTIPNLVKTRPDMVCQSRGNLVFLVRAANLSCVLVWLEFVRHDGSIKILIYVNKLGKKSSG